MLIFEPRRATLTSDVLSDLDKGVFVEKTSSTVSTVPLHGDASCYSRTASFLPENSSMAVNLADAILTELDDSPQAVTTTRDGTTSDDAPARYPSIPTSNANPPTIPSQLEPSSDRNVTPADDTHTTDPAKPRDRHNR